MVPTCAYNPRMRYVTRCPACLALFEVREAQRHAAQGWLRCGQCLTAFDSAGLVLPWPDAPAVATRSQPEVDDSRRLDLDTLLLRRDVPEDPVVRVPASAPEARPAPAAASVAPAVSTSSVAAVPLQAESLTRTSVPARSPAGVSRPAAQRRTGAVSWHRGGWIGGILLALAVAAFQGAQAYRGPLAMKMPAFERLGQDLCRTLGCQWPALHHAQALHLDHARLLREGDAFVLSIRLRNASAVTVASPHVAVTLRDQTGQTLARRVLALSALGAPPALPPGSVWEGLTQLMHPRPDDIAGFQVSVLGP